MKIKVDANEALKEIQNNKTLLIAQLTDEEPLLRKMCRASKR